MEILYFYLCGCICNILHIIFHTKNLEHVISTQYQESRANILHNYESFCIAFLFWFIFLSWCVPFIRCIVCIKKWKKSHK